MSEPTPTSWLTVRAAAELLGVSAQTLRRWDRSGALPAERHPVNNYRVYDEARLRAWMANARPSEEMNDAARGATPRDATSLRALVPRRDDALLARDDAMSALDRALAEGHPLVVVTGPPGVGKSRLVRAWLERDGRPRRTFCAVGACRSVEELALALGAALGVAVRAATTDALAAEAERAVTDHAGEVLVLDEIENLDAEGLLFIGRIVDAGATVVATSRVRPRLAREWLIVLGPLDYPEGDSLEEARASGAVALFLERARAAGALEVVDDEVLRQVAAIVRRLEGLPLAVELAASRTSAIGLRRLRRELETSIDGIGQPAIDAPAGHRTVHGAIWSSVERLSAPVRSTLEVACLLPQDFELEELEALLEDDDALAHLQKLVDHSMVSAHQCAASTDLCFSIHAMVREVVLLRADPDRRAELAARHAAWRAADAAKLSADRSSKGIERIVRAEDALKRAWSWTMDHLDRPGAAVWATDLARALGRTVESLGPSPVVSEVLDRTSELARARAVDDGRRAELELYRAFAMLAQSKLTEAKARYVEAHELARRGKDARFEALASCQLAWLAMREGDLEGGRRALDEASRVLEEDADPFPEMLISSLTGQLDLQLGRLASAQRGFERARALAVRIGDGGNEASASGFLGAVAIDRGAPAEAVRCYEQAIDIAVEHRASIMEAVFRGYRAIALHQLGDPRAEAAYHGAIACAERSRAVRFATLFSAWLGVLLAQRGELDEARRRIDAADALPDPQAGAVFSLHRGHLDLARADRAFRDGRLEEGRRSEALAYRRVDGVGDDGLVLRELRVARRFLEQAIVARPETPVDASVVVGWQAEWVEVDGARIELHRRVPLKRLVWKLALERVLEPGIPVDVAALVAATWPQEKLRPKSATRRLQVALSTLRQMGLRDVIESSGGGYQLSASRTIQLLHTA